jgi:hypothetical protein
LRRRVSKGVTLDANYTFAHETDDAVNILTGAYQNSHNPKLDYASGDIDVRHNFTLGAVWDLPVASSLPKRLAEGWQISTLLQARGGLPYTIPGRRPDSPQLDRPTALVSRCQYSGLSGPPAD